MTEHSVEKDVIEREAIRTAWQEVIDADGWDADVAEDMYARAVEGIAWGLVEATMDTADREPSAEVYHDARNTARRMMFTLAPRPVGIRWAVYEAGMWCGECDPADQDDDCCVLPPRIRAALTRVIPPGSGDTP